MASPLRMLSEMTKIPLTQHSIGIVTVNGTIGSEPATFRLDTTMPGIVYRCDCSLAKGDCSDSVSSRYKDATCPSTCSTTRLFDLIDTTNNIAVEPIASALTVADFAIPSFTMGRICPFYSNDLFDKEVDLIANGVLGLGAGPGPFQFFPSYEKRVDSLPWSKFSIYLTDSVKDTGSFLLGGGVDTELINAQELKQLELPTTNEKETGWSVQLSDFLADDKSVANCKMGCLLWISASSPVIQFDTLEWWDFRDSIPWSSHNCSISSFADENVYVCNDDIKLPRLGFNFDGQMVYLDQEHYTLPHPEGANRIAVMIQTSVKNDFAWYLGTPFLRAFYTSFDKDAQTVSFYCKEGINCTVKAKAKDEVSSATVVVGIVAAVFALALGIVAFVLWKRKNKRAKQAMEKKEVTDTEEYLESATPAAVEVTATSA